MMLRSERCPCVPPGPPGSSRPGADRPVGGRIAREHLPVDSDRYPTLDGYTVPHFDAKAEANAQFEQLGVSTTFLQTSFNWEYFALGLGPIRGEDGRLVCTVHQMRCG